MIISASSIIGDKVKNTAGEDLGKIEELMVDTMNGDVTYAAVSFGGFLGMGDKLFAVPLQKMRVDTEDEHLVLDVPKDRLENAPGFDKDNWPKDATWFSGVRDYYTKH